MSKLSKLSKFPFMLKEALAHCQNGYLLEAKVIYEEILRSLPNQPEALSNLGTIELQLGNIASGIAFLKKSTQIDKSQSNAQLNLSNGLIAIGEYKEALQALNESIQFKMNNADAYNNRGIVLNYLERFDEALDNYNRAIELKPDYAEAHNNRGIVLNHLERFDEALDNYNRAIELKPDYADSYNQLGLILYKLKKYDEAIINYKIAIMLKPNSFEAQNNLGLIYLTNKNFKEGWPLYEKRHLAIQLKGDKYFDKLLTDFTQLNQSTLLITGEQGIGDNIIYSSLLTHLKNDGNKYIVAFDGRLKEIYKRSFPHIQFILPEEKNDMPYDFYLPIGNLGAIFRSALEDFENQPKEFLRDDKELTKKYKSNFNTNKKYICGLSWKSQNKALCNPKSLSLEKISPILQLKNITFVDLQYGDTADDKKIIEDKYGIKIESINDLDKFNDIDGLASLISACDFIVTTSNVTAHLAGALGKKTYLFLPYSFGKIWYWHEGKGQSLWYPSVEMHTQANKNDWKTPIDEVLQKINKKYDD